MCVNGDILIIILIYSIELFDYIVPDVLVNK